MPIDPPDPQVLVIGGGPAGATAAALRAYARRQEKRYRLYRRLAVGFCRPAFRDLLLQPADGLGLREAVVTALAGVWPPSPSTRIRLALFFILVSLQRRFELVPRIGRDGGTPPLAGLEVATSGAPGGSQPETPS